jgi:hypothetical protein
LVCYRASQEILPKLHKNGSQLVVSMMAAVDYETSAGTYVVDALDSYRDSS